jgi:hypothetical protein
VSEEKESSLSKEESSLIVSLQDEDRLCILTPSGETVIIQKLLPKDPTRYVPRKISLRIQAPRSIKVFRKKGP